LNKYIFYQGNGFVPIEDAFLYKRYYPISIIKFKKSQKLSSKNSHSFEFNVYGFFLCFAGSLREEEEVLQWLIQQKTEDRIELITRVMLESMVEETQYLAVYFCKITFLIRY
jgi:hypothetical protein